MSIHIIVLLYPEAIYQPYEDEIQFAVSEDRPRAHAIPKTIGEHGRIGLFEPALGAEFVGVRAPDFGVFGE